MTAAPSRPLRKDAARNRARLLAAASELFAEHGLAATLNDVAHHAGVGVGTAYRHFPNKKAVIDALFEQQLQAVADVAQDALDNPDPWAGLVSFLERAMHMQFGDRGLNEIMNNPALGDARISEARDRIAPILAALVERAKAHGSVRPDLDQTDLIFIEAAVSAIMDRTRNLAPDLYRRYLALFLDGIRMPRGGMTPLPARALTADETHTVMTQVRRSKRR